MPTIIAAIIPGLVEVATEFLPVSSTGHLSLAGHALGFVGPRAATFEIIIQLGAILAVVWLYRDLLWRVVKDGIAVAESRQLVLALLVAFLPAALVGLLTHHWITAHLFTPPVVIAALIAGGVAILAIERWRPAPRIETVMQIGYRTALWIGIAQVCSLIPGVSRSGATIMGALLAGGGGAAAPEVPVPRWCLQERWSCCFSSRTCRTSGSSITSHSLASTTAAGAACSGWRGTSRCGGSWRWRWCCMIGSHGRWLRCARQVVAVCCYSGPPPSAGSSPSSSRWRSIASGPG